MAVAPAHRGHEIEAGGSGVAGFDTIDAFDVAEQAIMVADRMTAVVERHSREVAVIPRKTVLDGAAQCRLIPRRRYLIVVGQAGGIAIDSPRHAQRARLARHLPGEIAFIAGDGLRDDDGSVVGGTRHQSLDGILYADGLTGAQAEFGGSLLGGVRRNFHFSTERHLAGVEALEQQIKRHDLG